MIQTKPKYLTAPLPIETMPPGVPYIIGNEAAERFCFYGMKTVLVVFMTKFLLNRSGVLAAMSEEDAKVYYHLFAAGVYFFPIFGAILADAVLGSSAQSSICRLCTASAISRWPSTKPARACWSD